MTVHHTQHPCKISKICNQSNNMTIDQALASIFCSGGLPTRKGNANLSDFDSLTVLGSLSTLDRTPVTAMIKFKGRHQAFPVGVGALSSIRSSTCRHVRWQSSALTPVCVAQGQISDEELVQHVEAGKKAMTSLGFHGNSIWVQNICWGDHDQVSDQAGLKA